MANSERRIDSNPALKILDTDPHRQIPRDLVEVLRGWKFRYNMWWTIHYSVAGGSAVAAAVLAAAGVESSSARWLGVCVAAASAGASFVQSNTKGKLFAKAWRELTEAADKFLTDENFTERHLREARNRGEKILAKGD